MVGKVCEEHGISFIMYKSIFYVLPGRKQWGDSTKEENWVSEANKYGAESFEECHYFRGKLEDFEEHYGIYYLAIGSGTHNKVQTELTVFTMSLCYNVEINVSIIPSLSMIILH